MMTFEMFGAGCFGAVIGFVSWHVFRAGEASFDVRQFAAFVGALLGAAVLSAFPAGTVLFAAYSFGLALGFFILPVLRVLGATLASIDQRLNPYQSGQSSEVKDQSAYIEEHWPEVERVIVAALRRNKGSIGAWKLLPLPLDEAGRVSALRRYARAHPELVSFGGGFGGWTLRLHDKSPNSVERLGRESSDADRS